MDEVTSNLSDIEFIRFSDADSIIKLHDDKAHLMIYGSFDEGSIRDAEDGERTQSLFVMSALVSEKDTKAYMKKGVYYNYPFADLGNPGIWTEGESDEIHFSLGQTREGNDITANYFVRNYTPHGIGKPRFPVAQSFVFFHELSEHSRKYKHVLIDELEDVEVVVEEINPTNDSQRRVIINRHYLREYLTARNMSLALWTSVRRYCTIDGDFEPPKDIEKGPKHINVRPAEWLRNSENIYTSELVFKSIIRPYSEIKWSKHLWSFDDDEKLILPMIIDIDQETGQQKESTSTTEFLTPVYFRKEVLGKYIEDERSAVSTASKGLGQISYLDQWSITYGLNERDRIIVWLGDLEKLSYQERLYWRHFNVPPEGGIAKEFFESQIMAKWVNTTSLEKDVLRLRDEINSKFKNIHGKALFKVSTEDSENEKKLHTAVRKGSKALKPQILAIAKLFVDAVDKKAITAAIDDASLTVGPDGKKLNTIGLLQKYYEKVTGSQYSAITTLKLVWKLRSNYEHTFDEEFYIKEIDKYDSRLDPLDPSSLYPYLMKQLIRQLTAFSEALD